MPETELNETIRPRGVVLAVLGTAKNGYIGLSDRIGNIVTIGRTGPLAYRVNPMFNEDFRESLDLFRSNSGFRSLPEFIESLDFSCFAISGVSTELDRFAIHNLLYSLGFSDRNKFVVVDDIQVVLAAHGNEHGMAAKVSSGVAVLVKAPDQRVFTMGGRGTELADLGSGFYLGRRILQILLDVLDERVARDRDFSRSMLSALGLTSETQVIDWYYETRKTRHWRHRISDLTFPLNDLARESNPLAIELFKQAADQIGTTIKAAVNKGKAEKYLAAETVRITVGGSLWLHSPALRDAIVHQVNASEGRERIPCIALETATRPSILGALAIGLSANEKRPIKEFLTTLDATQPNNVRPLALTF